MKNSLKVIAVLSTLVAASGAFAQSQVTVTTKNLGTVAINPTYQNVLGSVLPVLSPVSAGSSNLNVNSGISNIISYHVDYSSASGQKRCRFDASSTRSVTTGQCTYTKAATSTGSSYATCTATASNLSTNPANCSFAVTFSMK